MKVALAFFGLPRAATATFPSIESRLLAPLRRHAELRVFHHLYRQSHVINPRSGENAPLAPANYALFDAFQGELEPRDPLARHPLLATFQAHGMAWEDGDFSLNNLLWQLRSLERVTALMEPWAPDVAIYARPDQVYHDALRLFDLRRAAACASEVALPGWGSWGGYNDRFAICGQAVFATYGNRIRQAAAYCEQTGAPLHSERLLRFVLDGAAIPVRPLTLRASRVRIDGRVESEPFDEVRAL
jgi:hypothetical protein